MTHTHEMTDEQWERLRASKPGDARLIAAAPDLLAALSELLRVDTTQGVTTEEYEAAYERANAALAKARKL